ncbi:MAG: histidine--tRNA ligase, partial [Gammaproteobacteria bacterium]|nr:histidine--tRNA ligase [Gammaproteobacteria bacterium]
EMLSVIQQIFQTLELKKTHLQINSLGDADTRKAYRQALVVYLKQYQEQLDQDSLRRLATNPMRILDSKNPDVQAVLQQAPSILDFLSPQSIADFSRLQSYLKQLGIAFQVNPRLVRGLDYYNNTVFEWVCEDFGAQATVCAGGRYDNMVEQLGGASTPGFGFAMGLERLIQILVEQDSPAISTLDVPAVFLVSIGEMARQQALVLQRDLTAAGLQVLLYCGTGSMKNQFKRADKSKARLALIIGEEEAAAQTVSIKVLIQSDLAPAQQTIVQNDALNAVTNLLESL